MSEADKQSNRETDASYIKRLEKRLNRFLEEDIQLKIEAQIGDSVEVDYKKEMENIVRYLKTQEYPDVTTETLFETIVDLNERQKPPRM